jgi:oligopeptide transport system substrate-binding protein
MPKHRIARRWYLRAALLSVLLVLTGAPGIAGVQAAQDSSGKVLRIHQQLYPETADPQKSSFSQEIAFLVTNYEGLTRLDENGQTSPAAAERWEFNADGTIVTFHLREGLTYSDGSPLTADRFVYSVQRACDPNTAGDYQYVLFDIVGCFEFASLYAGGEGATPVAQDDAAAHEAARNAVGISAPDDRTLVINLTHPAPYFPSVAGLWVFFPAQQEMIEAGGEAWWTDPANQLGNGPFQVTRIEQDQLITFAANENYWQGRPVLDGIELVYVADPAVALEAYNAGDLDIVNPDPAQFPAIRADAALGDQLITYPGTNTNLLSFNMQIAPFDDQKVREAFAYAFDRDTWCNVVTNGDCVATLSWIPEGVPGFVETDAFAFDPEKARQALAESSYGGAENLPAIEYHYIADIPEERPRGEWIAGQYRDILGVELTLVPVEQAAWIQSLNDPELFPQLTLVGWFQDYPDPQNWLSLLWSCGALFSAPAGYCNADFDALVQQADEDLDPETRFPLYEEAHRLLLADAVGVVISNQANVFLVKPNVTGYTPGPSDGEWPGQWASLLTIDVTR